MQTVERQTSILFPSYGRYIPQRDAWRVSVQGALVSEAPLSLGKRFLLRILQRWIDDPAAVLENPVFQTRTRHFLAKPLKRKRVQVAIASRILTLPKPTNSHGLFQAQIELPYGWVEEHRAGAGLQLRVASAECELGHEIQLVPPQGVSVISDIDDTIKHTDVASRRELLANTFLRPFESIPGMAEKYQAWETAGAAFHYVSASPWQLSEELLAFRQREGFPSGTMHLRSFRMREHMVRRLLRLPPAAKLTAIRNLFRAFPERRFVLIGDSGEYDPEIYGKIARRYPGQIAAIYIRHLPRNPMEARRLRRAFRRLPTNAAQVYESASELPVRLPE